MFEDPGIGVYVLFGKDQSGVCYELISPLGENSPIRQALSTGARILNHVAYLTDDLDMEAERFRNGGCIAAGPATPAVAYGGAPVQFFVTPLRFIIELIGAPGHNHAYSRAG